MRWAGGPRAWVGCPTSHQHPWCPIPAPAARGGAEWCKRAGRGGFLRQDVMLFDLCHSHLPLFLLLCPLLTRSSWSPAPAPLPLGRFFPSPFTIFTACFPSCICKAASNKALADNLILQHNQSRSFHCNISSAQTLGWSKAPVGEPHVPLSPPPTPPLALPSSQGTGRAMSPQEGQERGSCVTELGCKKGTRRGSCCACHF